MPRRAHLLVGAVGVAVLLIALVLRVGMLRQVPSPAPTPVGYVTRLPITPAFPSQPPSASLLEPSVPRWERILTPLPTPWDPTADRLQAVREFEALLDLAVQPESFEAWRGRSVARCRTFQGGIFQLPADELWSQECTIGSGLWSGSFRFYPDPEGESCTLQAVEFTSALAGPAEAFLAAAAAREAVSGEPRNSVGVELVDRLRAAVRRHFGVGEVARAGGCPWHLHLSSTDDCSYPAAAGCGSWEGFVEWCTPQHLAYLFVARPWDAGGRGQIGFGARWGAAREIGRVDAAVGWEDSRLFRHELPAWLLAEAYVSMPTADCNAPAGLLEASQQPEQDRALCAAVASLRCLDRDSAEYPALAFWLDNSLVMRAELAQFTSSPFWNWLVAELKGLGVGDVIEQGYDSPEGWIVRRPFLEDLAFNYQHTRWGQWALMQMTWASWDSRFPEMVCDEQFLEAIDRGERHLATFPESEARLPLLFALAQAYETWWSCSKSGPNDPTFIDASADPIAIARARMKAIAYYRLYVDEAGALTPFQRLWLRQVLFRLEHDIDTSQRAYSMFCD